MNREQRRAAKRSGRQPDRRERQVSQLMHSILDVDFKARFGALKTAAEVQCLASNDTAQIAADAGYLLFITLRALELDQFQIQDADVIEGLALMGNALADINEAGVITSDQRAELIAGMDYLDALVQVLPKKALSFAWRQVEDRAHQGDIGTASLNALLQDLSKEPA